MLPRSPGPRQKGVFEKIHSRRFEAAGEVSMSPQDIDHMVNANGLLAVNPSSQTHPIAQLMDEAASEWDAKVARQSKTLGEAVEEYRRRNGHPPPQGFDLWWRYVCDHDVQLPDEYDQIRSDLLLFRALDPHELRHRVVTARKLPMTFTISVRNGRIDTSLNFDPAKIHNAQVRIDQQLGLIKDVAAYLPNFDAVYSIDDVPTQFVEYNHRTEMMEYIDSQEGYFNPHADWDFTYRGWQAGCSSMSPLGLASIRGRYKWGKPQDSKNLRPSPFTTVIERKSFIKDHRAAMDPCQHPELIPIHSAFASKSLVVGPLIPVFSLSKTTMHADILGVPTEQVEMNGELIPWEQRSQNGLLWRGRTTGPWHKRTNDWRNSQRTRLVRMGNGRGWTHINSKDAYQSTVHMLPPKSVVGRLTLDQAAVAEEWEKVNSHYMDVAFTGTVIQCDKADGSCKALADGYKYRERMGVKEAAQYRYVIDVDGNAWSARFQRLISSGSVVFKSTVFPEWWTDRIQPWVHYVPVKVDYSDLYDSLAYFRGDLAGRSGHEDEAKTMARRALYWSKTHMRHEDMTAYVFRLYLEWARLLSSDREAAGLVYHPDMERTRKA